MKYFLITGFDEGKFIEPYMVETSGELPYVVTHELYGDKARYYEEISQSQVIENMKNGMELV